MVFTANCQDGLGHFFPTLPGGVRACQDGLGHFFSTFARLTGGGGGGGESKAICAMSIEPTHFKRGFRKTYVEICKKFQNCVKEKVIIHSLFQQ